MQQNRVTTDSDWTVRPAAASALGEQKNPQAMRTLKALADDRDDDVQRRCAELIEKRFETAPAAIEKYLPGEINEIARAERHLKQLGAERFPAAILITSRTNVTVDPQELAKFGTDLTALAEAGSLSRALYR